MLKLLLTISDAAEADIKEIMARTGAPNPTDVIARALASYSALVEMETEGYIVQTRSPDDEIQTIAIGALPKRIA